VVIVIGYNIDDFPYCHHGFILPEHEDHAPGSVQVDDSNAIRVISPLYLIIEKTQESNMSLNSHYPPLFRVMINPRIASSGMVNYLLDLLTNNED
jgi:hypothetical protein